MELKRKQYSDLLAWKEKPNHLPVVIRGLRQIGKSYLAEKFAFEQYGEKYCPVLDFRHNKNLFSIFENSVDSDGMTVEGIVTRIRAFFPNKVIEKGKTCFVMDEVGDCPLARESFKLFGSNSGYDIIATGSLLGLSQIRGNKTEVPTGFEEYLDMRPLDFIEFLNACGVSKTAMDEIRKSVTSLSPVSETVHSVLKSHLIRYVLIGGMPKAVTTYLETKDLNRVREIQAAIRNDYEDDFGKIRQDKGNLTIDSKLLVRTIRAFRSIPDQLAKENKKFKYSAVEGGGRSSEFSDALAWLEKTNIIRLAHNLRAIESPLPGNSICEEFKVYPSDIGLLISSYPATVVKNILDGDLGAYKGAIYEGLAADMLDKAGFPLFYFSDTKRHLENDFFIETNEGICVIESKATNGKMASSRALMLKETPYSVKAVYKLTNTNFGQGSYYQTIPQYAFPFLLELFQNEITSSLVLDDLPLI